jgi:tetratricopeptide (TPR) repeat protein
VQAATALCNQVARLHHLGIYHGLLHPGCIYREGDGWRLDETWLGQLVGVTRGEQVLANRGVLAGFVAPEVLAWRMPPTLASDIYGIASALYGAITGQPPLETAAALEIVRGGTQPAYRAITGLRSKASGISRRLESILAKALHADPAQRHRSLDQLIEELQKCRWPADAVETLVADARDAHKLGRLAEAYELLDKGLLLDPGNPLVHHVRAECFFFERAPKAALEENQKALRIDPTPPVLLLHGQCLMALQRYDEAEDMIREALAQEDSSRARHMLAQCLEKVGRTMQAIAQLEQALAIAKTESNTALTETIQSQLSALLARHDTAASKE